jgi:hypothetical protein
MLLWDEQDGPICIQKEYCQVYQLSRCFCFSFWLLRPSEELIVKRVLRDIFLSRDRPQLPWMLHCLPNSYSRRLAEQVLSCPHPNPFYRISSPVLNWIKFETMLQQQVGYKKWSESSELCHVQTPVFYFFSSKKQVSCYKSEPCWNFISYTWPSCTIAIDLYANLADAAASVFAALRWTWHVQSRAIKFCGILGNYLCVSL